MKLATIHLNGTTRAGVIIDNGSAVELFRSPLDLRTLITKPDLDREPREDAIPTDGVKFAAPILNPGKLLCLAGNYIEHIVESGFEAPEKSDILTPQVFLKPATCLTGAADEIPFGSGNVAVGWEVELAVVIGKRGRNISEQDALNYVFGYTVLNDVSERKLNSTIENRKKREFDVFFDWLGGKWFDGFAPCGPWVVSADEVPEPQNLMLRLWVNGELRQQASTSHMMFTIAEQISYISKITTLEPGDIIATGTPAGAGLGTGSKTLKDGDEVVCEIDGIGTLRNKVKATMA